MDRETGVPTEVELVYNVMPCNALRTAQEPGNQPHACTYFRKWGTYHSFDYEQAGPPPTPGIVQDTVYVGRAPLLPELLSGCRKAPIMAVGINPNLPGWYPNRRGSLNPLFDEYKQYAHYFRYRSVAKLEIPPDKYTEFGGGAQDTPFSGFELNVLPNGSGARVVPVRLQRQTMYTTYQSLLDSLAEEMGWPAGELTVGEDLAYGNMVACPSARWTTRPLTNDPDVPPMTNTERDGIVRECFRERKHFLLQLFQSLPAVLLVFSQSTASAFIAEMQSRLHVGDPRPDESIDDLMAREIRLLYGRLSDGTELDARVIFSPHITGNPAEFGPARARLIAQIVEEAQRGALRYNPGTHHLHRTRGSCVFCPALQIGPCDYENELQPLSMTPPVC